MKNHVKVKINGILNNSLFKITMIILCCLILSTSIIRTDNYINEKRIIKFDSELLRFSFGRMNFIFNQKL